MSLTKNRESPSPEARRRAQAGDPAGIEVLGDGSLAAALGEDDVAQPRRTLLARPFVQLVEEAARTLGGAGCGYRAHDAAGGDGFGEDAEAAVAEDLAHIGDDEGIAQIGLVGAVFQHRFVIGDARERHRPQLALALELLEHAVEHRLDGGEDILLGHEGHLEIELIELARRAVGAAVLVAEAGRDLEIAVEARDHQELLELLRRLGQGVELAGMQAARHQEVARTLGRARGQDRGLELGEPRLHHAPADAGDHPGAQQDVAVDALAAQIEEAVGEPQILAGILIAVDLERQHLGRGLQLIGLDAQLDLAGRKLRIDRLGRARHEPAGEGDDAFHPHRFDLAEERARGIDDALRDAVVIAQVDEQQIAVIALAVDPAGEAHRAAGIGKAELAAVMGSIGVHGTIQ